MLADGKITPMRLREKTEATKILVSSCTCDYPSVMPKGYARICRLRAPLLPDSELPPG